MRVNRRSLLAGGATAAVLSPRQCPGAVHARQAASALAFSYPLGAPDRPPGEGFFIRHGFTCENTWYFPAHWHTGEDWYSLEGDTAGAAVLTIADGEVVYTGGNYPGLVIIVQHAPDLFSMYGHLDFGAPVAAGDTIRRGDQIGTVLYRGDWVPNHLHFEVRTFLQTEEVNGALPRYGFGCGPDCPPGPGYWPIAAPDLPVDQGWRNPTHVINRRALAEDATSGYEAIVAPNPTAERVPVWSAPDAAVAELITELRLEPGSGYPLAEISAGAEATSDTSAEAYRVWYRLSLPGGETGWVRAAVPSTVETGGDGRASTVELYLLPTTATAT